MSSFQKGFVSQFLLVLLLAGGIAAGTLLVQNSTNFLPKAAGNTTACDGQTLASQSTQSQNDFRTAYGQDAETQWVIEHEKKLLCNYSESADKCFSGVCKAGSENDCGFNRNCIADPAGLCTKPVDCKTAGTSGYSSSGAGLDTSQNAGIICSDANQMIDGIPCYKIGVFDEATREQIEKNARIASNNYTIYQRILTEIGSLMEANARAKAEAALKTAQDSAACMK